MDLFLENTHYSFADCLAWEDEAPMEIIEGELFLMASPLEAHQRVLMELIYQIRSFLEGKPCRVYPAPFAVRLFEREGDRPEDVDTVLEPDITVVCDRDKLDRYGCRGAPDLVIEILPPSNRRHDLSVKYRLYQKAGVREYWIVDPDSRITQVFTMEDGLYNAPEVYTAETPVPSSLWEDFQLDLSRAFAE